ncbi:MAG: methyltransferase [Cellvibrionales bacterium]|nr:methyltransferase [Cellvibrionales bacterium]
MNLSIFEQSIFQHFDTLNADQSHFANSNDICTPMACVKEMVDSVPAEFWGRKNLKILDSCCGNGNFHAYIKEKTDLRNLYFNEINPKRIANAKSYFGTNINFTTMDFLEKDAFPPHSFDMVVSNPPYAKFCGTKRASKNHNLSRAFINRSIEIIKDGGYLLFIAPDNWMSLSDRNNLPKLMTQYQFYHLNIHGAKKYFPKVGSSFTWFLMEKSPNTRAFTVENHYKKTDRVQCRLEVGMDFIPLYYSDEVRKLLNKTVRSTKPKFKVETTSYLHRTTQAEFISDTPDIDHPYKLIHTPKQTVWAAKPHKYQSGWKVFISLTDRYKIFVDNCGMTQSIAFIRCQSKKQAIAIQKELSAPVYRAINNLTRYGNFNNIRVLQRLPRLSTISLSKKQQELVDCFAMPV